MKRSLNKTIKLIPLLLGVTCVATVGVGYASWQFSKDATPVEDTVGHGITEFDYTWTDSSILSETMYDMVESFTYAINNTGTIQGEAFVKAMENSKSQSGWGKYIGTMVDDSEAAANLKTAIDYKITYPGTKDYSSYTIFIKYLSSSNDCNNNSNHTSGYDIYILEGSLPASYDESTAETTYVSPIYKTCIKVSSTYTVTAKDGTTSTVYQYEPIQSYKGKTTVVHYRSSDGNASINTNKFAVIS